MKTMGAIRLSAGFLALLLAGSVSSQDSDDTDGGLSLLTPEVSARRVEAPVPAKYDFPDLAEVDSVDPFGATVSSTNVGSMSNFRRAFFVDEQSFVLQLPGSGRYYLGILNSPSSFEGRCARRPEALSQQGGTYILSCGRRGQPVARFYLLQDREQMEETIARIQR